MKLRSALAWTYNKTNEHTVTLNMAPVRENSVGRATSKKLILALHPDKTKVRKVLCVAVAHTQRYMQSEVEATFVRGIQRRVFSSRGCPWLELSIFSARLTNPHAGKCSPQTVSRTAHVPSGVLFTDAPHAISSGT